MTVCEGGAVVKVQLRSNQAAASITALGMTKSASSAGGNRQ